MRVLIVVARERAQHTGNARVVGARRDETQRQDGRLRCLGVVVVAEAAQRVGDGHLRVGHAQQRQCQRHRAAQVLLAVLQDVIKCADRHLRAQVLAQRHHGHAQARHRLVPHGLLLAATLAAAAAGVAPLAAVTARALAALAAAATAAALLAPLTVTALAAEVLRAHVEQVLHAQHAARAGVGAHLQRDDAQLAHSGVEHLGHLDAALDRVLLVEEE
mmetsp:Transcript_6453/g.19384  ORF Transcript_6453/g.19384 Transcript_6453/m.19384 type:complete len:217 (-) Transcript_6453:386-1036(-)